ncbi:ATP-binding protein [Brevundimonas sp.]|uniref:PAS domain-containing sensor histidine kinase n=1 Tax=Brevundimonas sp. TaxID=1871086 RepID=UPI001ACFBCE5|nr:ATP-binding protein [Brevundimonas sp.]MBN9466726.1 PAS domain S-box protein [Brevundimonas sp.]
MRIAVLGLALAATGYVLLVSREVTRPTRDVHRLEVENQVLSTRLAAEQVAALARAGGADAKSEIRLVSAADATMRVVSAQGAVLASDRPDEVGRAAASLIGVQAVDLPDLNTPRAVSLNGSPRTVIAVRAGPDGPYVVSVSDAPSTGVAALMDEAWVLIAPILLGLGVLGVYLFQSLRRARQSREEAQSEKRFRIAVEAARCGVWEWDLEEREVTLSDYMATLMGFDQGGVVPADAVIERIHPRFRDEVKHALRQAAVYGAFDVTFPVPDEQGRPRWIDARGQARGPRGESGFSAILGVALDITEARRAKAAAQAAESRLRDGVESISDAFVLFDRQGRLILWNQAFEDAFAFRAGVVRRGAMKDELNRIAALAIKAEHPAAGGRAGLREVELHDGRWLQLAERFTSEGGSVVTAADITAIKRQEAERRRAADDLRVTVAQLEASQEKLSLLARKYEVAMTRAEAANQAKSEFLANMSHELRTPLNAINGFSEIMAGELFGPLNEKYKGYAADILKSGQHLLSLINDILDMAKIEAGKMTLHYEPVSLKEVCEDAVRLMRGKAQEAGLTIAIEAVDLPPIQADHRGVKQVMLNLISNAVKFTPEGGRITLSLTPFQGAADEDRIRVACADTGIGIAPEDLVRLARPFEQVEGQHSKTTQGTGLGLALTKSLIEMHGGQLTMESQPGVGTVVSFDLPVKRPDQTVQPIRAAFAA